MSRSVQTDTEKKIAEIREGYKSNEEDQFTYKKNIVEQDIRFLLSELERKDEEIRKLREERDDLIDGLLVYAEQRIGSDDDGEHARNILREIGVTVE